MSEMRDSITNDPPIYQFVEKDLSPEAVAHWWTLSPKRKNDIIVRAFGMVRHVCNAHTFEGLHGDALLEEFNRQVIERVERMCLK
jgi:hypothetical protein